MDGVGRGPTRFRPYLVPDGTGLQCICLLQVRAGADFPQNLAAVGNTGSERQQARSGAPCRGTVHAYIYAQQLPPERQLAVTAPLAAITGLQARSACGVRGQADSLLRDGSPAEGLHHGWGLHVRQPHFP